jgi:phosphate starvation-inducible PhoH-like protein
MASSLQALMFGRTVRVPRAFMSMKKSGGPTSRGKSLSPYYKPKSENQSKYVSFLKDSDSPIVLGIGPAGCGKTLFACITAIEELKSGNIQKIVLTRPIVPVEEEELGFLPGNLVHKMDPWTRPIFDIFLEFYQQKDLDAMIMTGVIEVSPLAYMRGRTFKRSFIIADEMQNSTPNQMMMLMTRIGLGSKMVITGDLKQSDRSLQNGLLDFMNRLRVFHGDSSKNHSVSGVGIHMVEMTAKDIERSPIVSKVLDIYKTDYDVVAKREITAIERIENTWTAAAANNGTSSGKAFDLLAATRSKGDAALMPISDIPKSKF